MNSASAPLVTYRSQLSPWLFWGRVMVVPYLLIFLVFVLYPVCYGLWIARHPASYEALLSDPIFFRTLINTLIFLAVAINVKMMIALALSGFFTHQRWWIKGLSVIFILPWAVPSIPTILSVRFMLNPEWGVINSAIFRWTGLDGPNWLTDPTLALSFSMLMPIWKSLPFWTLILLAGRMAIPAEHYEAASVDGATRWQKFRFITWPSMAGLYVTSTVLSMIWTLIMLAGRMAIPSEQYEAASVDGASTWQKFRFITWPSMKTLYLTSTILSTIWTLGDFNSVYLLTGGGPADLTHVLATLGIRYLRLDLVDQAMAAIVVAMPVVLPLVYFMMKRLSK